MSDKDFYIKNIPAEMTRPLRQLILRPHQLVDELIYPGDNDEYTIHLGAFHKEELVGIVSLFRQKLRNNKESNSWRFRGMATVEAVRGMGFAKCLMNHCIEYVKSNDGKILWCSARTSAAKFYEKFGMKRISGIYYPGGIGPHIIMSMKIKKIK